MSIVEGKKLVKRFSAGSGLFRNKSVGAVESVDIAIEKGETLGLIGESGCGKSTLGMLLLKLIKSDSGDIFFNGKNITKMTNRELRPVRKKMQVIFQDPYASLNPRFKIKDIVGEPLVIQEDMKKPERLERVKELLDLVGLPVSATEKYPHEFSGGQRQRIGIARAIALNPDFIVADEAVSALDVSVRGGILNLLEDLQDKLGLSYLFISHDLKVVEYISKRIAVMYLGRIVELLPHADFDKARHPYTRALSSSVPEIVGKKVQHRIVLKGDVPSPISPPTGCPFHPRCPDVMDRCKNDRPSLKYFAEGSAVACFLFREVNDE